MSAASRRRAPAAESEAPNDNRAISFAPDNTGLRTWTAQRLLSWMTDDHRGHWLESLGQSEFLRNAGAAKPRQRSANPTGTQRACVCRQHEVLRGPRPGTTFRLIIVRVPFGARRSSLRARRPPPRTEPTVWYHLPAELGPVRPRATALLSVHDPRYRGGTCGSTSESEWLRIHPRPPPLLEVTRNDR